MISDLGQRILKQTLGALGALLRVNLEDVYITEKRMEDLIPAGQVKDWLRGSGLQITMCYGNMLLSFF